MFVTFYSYKGGVGRSMALANIACLLAEDPDHPQRVLLWDFDLEAPGLHKLFPPPQPFRRGFVDMAFEFAQNGQMPDPAEFIYHSELEGVDVLPAGSVDKSYCAKLERIDWLGFFGENPTDKGHFFEELTKWMRATPQEYDYVLIDSRTGLNDVAGICTQVLPDLILFIFRLTDQNLDGIEHLVPTIRSQLKGREKKEVKIFPVASGVLSQSSKELNARRKRAMSVFQTDELSYIRFDPDLIADEKLFCRLQIKESMWPLPAIVDDYERLCKSIRSKNSKDTRTSARLLDRAMRERDYATAQPVLEPLLRRRPTNDEVWRHFRRLCNVTPDSYKQGDKLVQDILADAKNNIFALEWMASKYAAEANSSEDENLREARNFLERAISIQPKRVSLHRKLAEIASAQGDLEHATKSLRKSHVLKPDNVQIQVDLANLYVRMGQEHFDDALKALDQGESEVEELAIYLWAFLGDEEKAQHAFQQCLESSTRLKDDWHYEQLVHAHCLLLQRKTDRAKTLAENCLSSNEHPADESDILNWAEFFLCAEEGQKALELLAVEETADDDDQKKLHRLTNYLNGNSEVTETDVLKVWKVGSWRLTELIFFRERMGRLSSNSYGDRLKIIEKLNRESVLSSQNEGSVFWRRSSSSKKTFRIRVGDSKIDLKL